MTDVLESGPRRGGRRRPAVVAVVVVGAVALVGLRIAASDDGRPTPPPAAVATPTPAFTQPTWPTPTPTCAHCRAGRYQLDARPGYGPPGVRLLGGGVAPLQLDVHTGRTTYLGWPRLGSGQTVRFFAVDRSVVATVLDADQNPVAAYLRSDSGGTVRLGRFATAIAGHDGGVLAFDPSWADPPGLLVSFTMSGEIRWRHRLEEIVDVVADTPYGLLVHVLNDEPQGGPLRLIDPRTGVLRRTIGPAVNVLATDSRSVAFIEGPCPDEGGCALHVADLRTGRTASYPAPLDRTPSTGAFSPDGRMLALGVAGLTASMPGVVRDGFVGVLDLRDGHLTRLPGLSTAEKMPPVLAWAPGGDWLLMAAQTDDEQERVVMWRVGDPWLTVLPTVLPGWTLGSGPWLVVRS